MVSFRVCTRSTILATGLLLASLAARGQTSPTPPPFFCIGSSCVESSTTSSSSISFTPGHYVEQDSTLDNTANRTALSSIMALGSSWQGACNFVKWGHLEATKNDYSKGDAYLDWLFAQANAAGKKVILILDDKKYNGYAPSDLTNGLIMPTYLRTDSAYANSLDPAGNNGYYVFSPYGSGNISILARTWTAPVMDRFIALVQHLGARYANESALEGIFYSSVSIGGSSTQITESDYTIDAHLTQVKRWGVAARAAFPNKIVGIMADWTGTMSRGLDLVSWGRAYDITWSDYDTADFKGRTWNGIGSSAYAGMRSASVASTNQEAYGKAAFRGASLNSGGNSTAYATTGLTASGSGGTDMRGKTAFVDHVQSPDWSMQRFDNQGIEEFSDIHKFYKATHVCWTKYSWEATRSDWTPANQSDPWTNIIRPWVENHTLTETGINSTYPTDWR